jgi:hypothetical protein
VKPKTAQAQRPSAPYVRDDDFSGPRLANVWQWSHVPVDSAWALRDGHLQLKAQPATSLWDARNTLTQRSIGPRSSPVAVLDVSELRDGDVAGLALFNRPYAWIGVERVGGKTRLATFDDMTARYERRDVDGRRVWLRADCDFIIERATFSYSLDGKKYTTLGEPFTLVFQLGTFQGIRYSLFAYNTLGGEGGTASFDSFGVEQPHPQGLLRPIPLQQQVRLASAGADHGLSVEGESLVAGSPSEFRVRDMKLGRVALEHRGRLVSIATDGSATLARRDAGNAEAFQWIETPNGDLVLMSLATNRFLRIDPASKRIAADSPGPLPDGSDGVRFRWHAH